MDDWIWGLVVVGLLAAVYFAAIPGRIASSRNHPNANAIAVLGFVGMFFTASILWWIAIVWAYTGPERSAHNQEPVPAGTASVADEIEKLANLRDRGVLTDAEFEAQKRLLLPVAAGASMARPPVVTGHPKVLADVPSTTTATTYPPNWRRHLLIILLAVMLVSTGVVALVVWRRGVSVRTSSASKRSSMRAPSVSPRPLDVANVDQAFRGPYKLEASSTMQTDKGYTYVVDNLFDHDVATSWQPRRSDRHPQVLIKFPDQLTLTSIEISNGFQAYDAKDGDEFVLNSRIAHARLRFADSSEIQIQFDVDERMKKVDLGQKRTREVTLLVDDVHRGTKWRDLAISEISFRYLGSPPPLD